MRPIRKVYVKKENLIINIKRQSKHRFIIQTQKIESNVHQQALITKLNETFQKKLKKKGSIFYHVLVQPSNDEVLQDHWIQHAIKDLDSTPFDFIYLVHNRPYDSLNEKLSTKGSKTIFVEVFPFFIPDQLSA